MKAGRRATAAVTQMSLPSHYPVSMYNSVAGGTQRWCSQIRPPLYRAMRLGDLPLASRLRSIWRLEADALPPEAFLQPLDTGWVGLENSPYIMYSSFMEVYIRQLNHDNPSVRSSTRHGLLQAKLRFNPRMSCLSSPYHAQECLVHADDHSRFLILCHRLCLAVHVPVSPVHAPLVPHPMHQCQHEWQADDVHSWMEAGYSSSLAAQRAGWPCRFVPVPNGQPPFSTDLQALSPEVLDLPASQGHPTAYIHDASWFPGHHHSGGAVAVLNLDTGAYTVYPIRIPIFCNNSYQAELYVAWAVLRARRPTVALYKHNTWTFSDSKSYITALESRNDGSCPFVAALLAVCRDLSAQWEVPRHLYSHLHGTFLDTVLESVDTVAKDTALSQTPRMGWISPIQEPLVCFENVAEEPSHQVHDPVCLLRRGLRANVQRAAGRQPVQTDSCFRFYEEIVMRGYLTWAVHLIVVAIRHNLGTPSASVCPFCGATMTMRHYVDSCIVLPLLRVFFHSRLLLKFQEFCPRWRVLAVTKHDVRILHGTELFGIRYGSDPFHATSPYPYVQIGFTGEISPQDVSLILSRGMTRNALRHVVTFLLNELAALHRDHHSLTLPVVPHFSACHPATAVYTFHWSPLPTTLRSAASWTSHQLHAPGWPHPALLMIMINVIPFVYRVPVCIAGVLDGRDLRRHLPLQYWWTFDPVRPESLRGVTELLWDNFPNMPPPDPWPVRRRLWELSYGAPERTITLYILPDGKPRTEHVRLRTLFVQALRLVRHQPQLTYTDLWVRLRAAQL